MNDLSRTQGSQQLVQQTMLGLGAAAVALAVGWAVGGSHWKTAVVIVMPGVLAVAMATPRSVRFRLLCGGILLSPLAWLLPTGLGLTVTSACLVFAALGEASTNRRHLGLRKAGVGRLVVVSGLSALAVLGAFVTLSRGEFSTVWVTVCLTPLVVTFLALRLASTLRHAVIVQLCALAAMSVQVLEVVVARLSGVQSQGLPWRLGTQALSLGDREFVSYATTLGALCALGLVAIVVGLGNGPYRDAMRSLPVAALALAAFLGVSLLLTAARAAAIAAACGVVIGAVALPMGTKRLRVLAYVGLVAGILVLAASVVPSAVESTGANEAVSRYSTLGSKPTSIGNWRYRWDLLTETVEAVATDAPLGRGFHYLWRTQGADEGIAYSVVLNGVGLPGTALYLGTLLLAAGVLISRRTRSPGTPPVQQVALAAIMVALVNGWGTEAFLLKEIHVVALWSLIGAGLAAPSGRVHSGTAGHRRKRDLRDCA